MSDDPARFVYLVVCILLLAASFAARRVPIRDTFKMILAWVSIFSILFIVFTFRSDFARLWKHVKADISGTTSDPNGEVRIKKGDDGHFTARVTINGKPVSMLIDTGATSTVISAATAQAAGIDADGGLFDVPVNTANGTVMLKRAQAATFTVGAITREDFGLLVSDQDELNLIGMSFLSDLTSWRVEGDEMILVP